MGCTKVSDCWELDQEQTGISDYFPLFSEFPKPWIVEWMFTSLPSFRYWIPNYKASRERPFCWVCMWSPYNAIFNLLWRGRKAHFLHACIQWIRYRDTYIPARDTFQLPEPQRNKILLLQQSGHTNRIMMNRAIILTSTADTNHLRV